MSLRRILTVRADASVAIGTGHVMRCLTLAEEARDRGWQVQLLTSELPAALADRCAQAGLTVRPLTAAPGSDADADALAEAAAESDAVLLDGYGFSPAFRARSRRAASVLALDDGVTPGPLHADLVLNASAAADRAQLEREAPGATLLLGPGYALIRREIRRAAAGAPAVGTRGELLVMFGGSDPLRLTAAVTEALLSRLAKDGPRIRAIVGGTATADPFPDDARLIVDRDVRELGNSMARAGLAISAGGGTLGELALCGVPTLVAVVADNQAANAAAASSSGWHRVIDVRGGLEARRASAEKLATAAAELWRDVAARSAMSAAARALLDGNGAARAIDALELRLSAPSAAPTG